MIPGIRIEHQGDIFTFPSSLPKPAAIHTIQNDMQGNIYYSDELNHTIVSLNREGELRWFVAGKGSLPGDFRYPRGLALGWIFCEEKPIHCLAVADSWNRRIQFLDKNTGQFLTEWHLQTDGFGEPVDLRFISYRLRAEEEASGYWLILDKGQGCLWTIDISGRMLRRWGRVTDPGTAARWLNSGTYPDLQMLDCQQPSEQPAFDLLFYPERILGTDTHALFIWEPSRLTLKLIYFGNFIPLSIGTHPDREWIAADASGFSEWSRSMQSINFYDAAGALAHSTPLTGTPVPSNLPSNELWLQTETGVYREQIIFPAASNDFGSTHPILIRESEAGLASLNENKVRSEVAAILQLIDKFIDHANHLTTELKNRQSTISGSNGWEERVNGLLEEWNQRLGLFYAALHTFSLSILELRLTLCSEAFERSPASKWNLLHKPFASKLAPLALSSEDLFLSYLPLTLSSGTDFASGKPEPILSAERLTVAMRQIAEWLLKWTGLNYRICARLAMPCSASNLDVLRKPVHPSGSALLREIPGKDRFLLRELVPIDCAITNEAPGMASYIAADRAGKLYVSLQKANRIVGIDEHGASRTILGEGGASKVLNQPTGIAFDAADRLWIADSGNHRIVAFDPPYKEDNLAIELGNHETPFVQPHGLVAMVDGTILATDLVTNTVYRIIPHAAPNVVLSTIGSGLDQVRYPNSFCLDILEPQQYVWLVEKRNHRLLKLDTSYRGVEALGSIGIGPGHLYYPMTMAIFSDGVIAVAQGLPYPSLIFLNANGRELARLYLDYYAFGVLIRDDILYVCDHAGDLVHRYIRS